VKLRLEVNPENRTGVQGNGARGRPEGPRGVEKGTRWVGSTTLPAAVQYGSNAPRQPHRLVVPTGEQARHGYERAKSPAPGAPRVWKKTPPTPDEVMLSCSALNPSYVRTHGTAPSNRRSLTRRRKHRSARAHAGMRAPKEQRVGRRSRRPTRAGACLNRRCDPSPIDGSESACAAWSGLVGSAVQSQDACPSSR
jgi:hypothetical protein